MVCLTKIFPPQIKKNEGKKRLESWKPLVQPVSHDFHLAQSKAGEELPQDIYHGGNVFLK